MTRLLFARRALFAAAAVAFSLGLAACEEEGPAEQLGETVDESVEETGDAAEEAGEEVEENTE